MKHLLPSSPAPAAVLHRTELNDEPQKSPVALPFRIPRSGARDPSAGRVDRASRPLGRRGEDLWDSGTHHLHLQCAVVFSRRVERRPPVPSRPRACVRSDRGVGGRRRTGNHPTPTKRRAVAYSSRSSPYSLVRERMTDAEAHHRRRDHHPPCRL